MFLLIKLNLESQVVQCEYINNSLHLARKYARIFVRGHYLFREANSFARVKLEENCELRVNCENIEDNLSAEGIIF